MFLARKRADLPAFAAPLQVPAAGRPRARRRPCAGRGRAGGAAPAALRPRPAADSRRLRQGEVLDPNARLLGPLAFRILLHERLVRFGRIGIARLLPVALLIELFEPSLGLGGEFAARILLQELLVGIRGIGFTRLLPVALLAAAARKANRPAHSTQPRRFY